jgi:hypothetical protein
MGTGVFLVPIVLGCGAANGEENMRAIFLVPTLAIVGIASPANADSYSGNDILKMCTSTSVNDQNFCAGYSSGIFEEIRLVHVVQKTQDCVPVGVTYGQVEDVIVKYLKDNPADRNSAAVFLVTAAIGDAWKCGPQ